MCPEISASVGRRLAGVNIGRPKGGQGLALKHIVQPSRRRNSVREVAQAQDWIDTAQCFAQATANAPTRASDQHSMHFRTRHSFLLIVQSSSTALS